MRKVGPDGYFSYKAVNYKISHAFAAQPITTSWLAESGPMPGTESMIWVDDLAFVGPVVIRFDPFGDLAVEILGVPGDEVEHRLGLPGGRAGRLLVAAVGLGDPLLNQRLWPEDQVGQLDLPGVASGVGLRINTAGEHCALRGPRAVQPAVRVKITRRPTIRLCDGVHGGPWTRSICRPPPRAGVATPARDMQH